MIKKLILFFVSFLVLAMAQAQDAQISMFTTSPLQLNPAAAGYFQTESWRIWLNHRDQWSSFLSRGIVTSNISFDMPFQDKKMAVGIYISNNMATKGALNDLSCVANYAYKVQFGQQKVSNLSFGIQAGFKQRSYNPSKIAFENNFVDGQGFDLSTSNGETNTATSKFLPDFNAGALWFLQDNWSMFQPWAGVGVYHLLAPDQSFTSTKDALPRKYVMYTGAEIVASKMIQVRPQLLVSNQANLTQANMGATVRVANYKNKNATTFEVGSYYRNREAVILMLGFEFSHYSCMVDYEITSSSLNAVNNGNGAFEITLRYMHAASRAKSKF